MRRMLPRGPKRPREITCFSDCEAQYTENPGDCHCVERDEAAYENECERRLSAWLEGE